MSNAYRTKHPAPRPQAHPPAVKEDVPPPTLAFANVTTDCVSTLVAKITFAVPTSVDLMEGVCVLVKARVVR